MFEDVQLIPQILLKAEKTVIVPDTLVHYNTHRQNSLTLFARPEILKGHARGRFESQARCIVAYDPTLRRRSVDAKTVRWIIGGALAAAWPLSRSAHGSDSAVF